MFRIMHHHLSRARLRLVPCDCFDLVPLPALAKIDMPQFTLIMAAIMWSATFILREGLVCEQP